MDRQRSGNSPAPIEIAVAGSGLDTGASSSAAPFRALVVVAHPDDEYYCAGTVYRLTRELGAVVDQLTVTNGESGFRFSHLAEQFYGISLTNPEAARTCLPEIRRREALAASRILGIRTHRFLNQLDDRCEDDDLLLGQVWNRSEIASALRSLLSRERYGVVFTILPTAATHPHHRLVTQIVVDVVQEMDPPVAPLVLGAEATESVHPLEYSVRPREGAACVQHRVAPDIVFDRRQSVGATHHARYDVIVNWVIAEHKSQGLFQHEVGRHRYECFWLLNRDAQGARRRLSPLGESISGALGWPEERTA